MSGRDLGVKALRAVDVLRPVVKAVAAGVGAFVGTLAPLAADGTTTQAEWWSVVSATALAAGAAYFAPKNKPRGGDHSAG